jgi:two-component system sensor histidine kinase UhpB
VVIAGTTLTQARVSPASGRRPAGSRYIPLFWRLFVPNAAVLLAACIVLIVEPANGRVYALAGGLAIMLAANLILMRRAFGPLRRLTELMESIDPLEPGRRLPPLGPESEVTQLTESFNAMLDRLEEERRESGYRALVAQEAERRRVSAELHDEIGQQLTALLMQLDRVTRKAPPGVAQDLETTTAAARETLDEVRGLARRLRPEVLDELGLIPALRNLCDRLSADTDLVVHRSLGQALPALSDDAELVIYRVAQESLTNVIRHAEAERAYVSLEADEGAVWLLVGDDGVGLPAGASEAAEGGIRGMRERALLIGARLEFGRAVSGGNEVRLRVPIATNRG